MFCRNCGSPVAEGDTFCGKCGARTSAMPEPAAYGPAEAGSPSVAPSQAHVRRKAKKRAGAIAAIAAVAVAAVVAVAVVLPGAVNREALYVMTSQTVGSDGKDHTITFELDAHGNNTKRLSGDTETVYERDDEGYLVNGGMARLAQERDLQGRVVQLFAVDGEGNSDWGISGGSAPVILPVRYAYGYYDSGYVKTITMSYLPNAMDFQCVVDDYDEEGFIVGRRFYESASPTGNVLREASYSWTKDSNGNPLSCKVVTKAYEDGSVSSTSTSTTQFETDAVGNIVKSTDSNGSVTEFTYQAVSEPSAYVRAVHGHLVQ